MYRTLLADARFYELLLAFDRDIAAAARAVGCSRCGGVLHSARFRRKPRGGPAGLGEAYDQRLSFCCASDLCRKRMTPPSFRFLGRKVYLGAVVVLVSAMRQGATAARQLCELVGVGRRTIARWREWWRRALVAARSGARYRPPSCRQSTRNACRSACSSVFPARPPNSSPPSCVCCCRSLGAMPCTLHDGALPARRRRSSSSPGAFSTVALCMCGGAPA